jgi:hypothetical protein
MNTIRILDVVLRAAPHAPFAGSGTRSRSLLSLALMGHGGIRTSVWDRQVEGRALSPEGVT